MKPNTALVQAHIAVFFMGIASVLAEASGFEPWRTTSYRVTFGGVVLALVWLLRPKRQLPALRSVILFLGLGVLLSIHWFAFFRSIELLGVMLGSAMLGMEPLVIAIAAALFLKERLNRATLIGMGISMIGFVVLGLGGTGEQSQLWLGVFWSIFAFILFALLVVANRTWVRYESPLLLTTLQMIGAIPLSVIMMDQDWLPKDPAAWGFALTLGLLCTGLAYWLYNTSMKVLSAPVAGLLLSLEVVYGILGGWLIGDTLTPRQIIAIFLIANILFIDLWRYWRRTRRPITAET